MKKHNYYIYILSSDSGTLYIGVTNNLERRLSEHKQKLIDGFTKKYSCHKLIYYEHYNDINNAIERETQLKKWRREKKEYLIKTINPTWKDLSSEWC
ncbi:MAG: GIY-YIG nuclease family protein [Candidatus Magasanikbacteria bacterium]|jgi:putative endonuclease